MMAAIRQEPRGLWRLVEVAYSRLLGEDDRVRRRSEVIRVEGLIRMGLSWFIGFRLVSVFMGLDEFNGLGLLGLINLGLL